MNRNFLVIGIVGMLAACATAPPEKRSTPTPTPVPTAQIDAVKIDAPANVSFSTYSKEWPVGWQWIDPLESVKPTAHDVKNGVLRVVVESKRDLVEKPRSSPRYLKAIEGDFQIETRVRFAPKENYQGAGLLLFQDDGNFIRFDRSYGGIEGGGEGLRVDVCRDGHYTTLATPDELPFEGEQIDLRLSRSGERITAYWRADEESEWREAAEFKHTFAARLLAGISVSNTARPVTAEFVHIKLLPAAR